MKRGAPLKTYARIERRTPLRSDRKGPKATWTEADDRRMVAFPKPSRRPNAAPKPIPRSRMKPSARGTKHSRRQRHLGYLLFCKHRACEARLLFGVDPCRYDEDGLSEAAHLGERKGYRADDLDSSSLCGWHHRDNGIDQSKGPFLGWTREQKLEFKIAAIARAQAEWLALTPVQRDAWDERAARTRRRAA